MEELTETERKLRRAEYDLKRFKEKMAETLIAIRVIADTRSVDEDNARGMIAMLSQCIQEDEIKAKIVV